MTFDGSPHGHAPIMVRPVRELLAPAAGQCLLDATLGRGGHGAALIDPLGPGGTYIGLDLDPANAAYAQKRLEPIAREAGVSLHVVHRGFAQAPQVLEQLGIEAVDALLADLGFASNQVDEPERGLSFSVDGPLDMRLDPGGPVTAADLLAQLDERELADLIYRYGEERLSRRIARKIVEGRGDEPMHTTRQLAALVKRAYGPAGHKSRLHPATRTFQALRIAVNGELASLEQLLADLPRLLKPGGRAAVMSFHSLEDRPVKRCFSQLARDQGWRGLTRKPVTATDQEIQANPRSRSAKLRAVQSFRPSDEP